MNVSPSTFDDLGLAPPFLRAVREAGYSTPTPIQVQAIPPVLKGRDVLACAQTGTGKTAAFTLPLLQRLDARDLEEATLRALVITPTRELASQIGESIATYGKHVELWHTVIFGGVKQKRQVDELERGIDVLVATPGRLLDLMSQGFVDLRRIGVFVLDEADRMLDMGFLPDVKRIIAKLPRKRQTLFFSATMPRDIRALANDLLIDPVSVSVTPPSSTAERIEQRIYFVDKSNKPKLLIDLLKSDADIGQALVFTRTKHGANRLAKKLDNAGLRAGAIHGNKSQSARERTLRSFKSGELRLLVATDIAARGIDIEGIGHVINFDLPNVPETYVHRIGRTGRAGASGVALSFCDAEERDYLVDIERLIRQRVPRIEGHSFPPSQPPPPPTQLDGNRSSGRRARTRRRGRSTGNRRRDGKRGEGADHGESRRGRVHAKQRSSGTGR